MRKVILAAVCCMVAMATQAREVSYNVYYNEIINTRGELYLYSERYLGTTDVILEDSHSYTLEKIKVVTPTTSTTPTPATEWKAQEKTSIKAPLPLSEEALMATNLAKKAESVAKQIYRIRETRMNILSGDVEHIPADGKAMQLVLDELKQQEEALTSMFVGKSVVKTHRQRVSTTISDTDKAIQKPLCKFSKTKGVLDPAAQEGDVLTMIITHTTQAVLAPIQPKKGEPVYEEKVVSCKTKITYLNKTIYAQIDNL